MGVLGRGGSAMTAWRRERPTKLCYQEDGEWSDPELCFGIIGLFVNKSMPSHREKE